jgi:hypothetical protein
LRLDQSCELQECGLLTVASAARTLTLWMLGRNVCCGG